MQALHTPIIIAALAIQSVHLGQDPYTVVAEGVTTRTAIAVEMIDLHIKIVTTEKVETADSKNILIVPLVSTTTEIINSKVAPLDQALVIAPVEIALSTRTDVEASKIVEDSTTIVNLTLQEEVIIIPQLEVDTTKPQTIKEMTEEVAAMILIIALEIISLLAKTTSEEVATIIEVVIKEAVSLQEEASLEVETVEVSAVALEEDPIAEVSVVVAVASEEAIAMIVTTMCPTSQTSTRTRSTKPQLCSLPLKVAMATLQVMLVVAAVAVNQWTISSNQITISIINNRIIKQDTMGSNSSSPQIIMITHNTNSD